MTHMAAGFFRSFFCTRSSVLYVLSVCLLQKRARSLELAPDQIRNQLVFNNPQQQQQQQHSLGGGTPPAAPSFFNNHYNTDNTFYKDQQLPSFTGSSTDVDRHFIPGHQIAATTYKPTFNLPRLQQQNLVQQHHQRQHGTHNSFSFQAPTQQRDVSSSFQVIPSISISESFLNQPPPPPPPPQQTYSNASQQPRGPQFYNAQTQQASSHSVNNQAINFQHQQQQQLQDYNRRNGAVYTNQFANNSGRSSGRVTFHDHPAGQPFVQYQ
jgi:hypothetical protein